MTIIVPSELIPSELIPLPGEKKLVEPVNPALAQQQKNNILRLLKETDSVLIAHYYADPEVQALADETSGFIGDSLEMARFGSLHDASRLIVVGVRFMGETAKILSPDKQVLMPTLKAECSLDLGCQVDEFSRFCDQHPEREVVVYANTSAAVKARADWVVTSSCALDIVDHLDALGKKVLWAPDKYLGHYIQKQTRADMLLWDGSCIVHEEFKAKGIADLKKVYPDAAVLVHPESPDSVVQSADVVGSTSRLLKATTELDNSTFIVATDQGIFYKMQQASPGKKFIAAPTAGQGATCKSCARCPWMAMNTLNALEECLMGSVAKHQIEISEAVRVKAQRPLDRMLNFTSN